MPLFRCLLFCGLLTGAESAQAECRVDRGPAGASSVLTLRLGEACTDAEREVQAIQGQDILRALAAGKGLDLVGVVIRGDVVLDALPVQKAAAIPGLSPDDRAMLEGLQETAIHPIHGPFIIKDARVQGKIVNRLKQGVLLITGPVVLSRSRFESTVDLSRTVFLGLVDGSDARFAQESYFVQDHFTQGAMFSGTQFGTHARFHRSAFAGPAIFRGATFLGVTEFLEVRFEKEANFSNTHFHVGTGFSGALCRSACTFAGAQFDRETFFLFTRFERAVTFASAHFKGPVDFSDAVFQAADDLAQAGFTQPPVLTRTSRLTTTKPVGAAAEPGSQMVTIGLILAAMSLLAYVIKMK